MVEQKEVFPLRMSRRLFVKASTLVEIIRFNMVFIGRQ
jgi:hypothetical protein